jgi:hypothetical protein
MEHVFPALWLMTGRLDPMAAHGLCAYGIGGRPLRVVKPGRAWE